jgi:septal ring-binding cell division protein DamX
MNENRDDWDCVQDEELARHPKPKRLPGDEEEIQEEAEPVVAAPFIAPAVSSNESSDSSATEQPTEPAGETPEELIEAPAAISIDLLALPGERYAVQLIAMANLNLAEQFTAEHSLDDAITVQLARDEELYVVVLLGVYATYAEAEAAVDGRAESLADIKPWIRPLESIQAGLEAAANLIAANDS